MRYHISTFKTSVQERIPEDMKCGTTMELSRLAVKFFVDYYSTSGYNIKGILQFDLERNGVSMASILPVSDLRNYNEVLKNCQIGEPVFLTKNGRGRFVVMDIEDYERDKAEKRLLERLHEAEEAVKDGNGWLTMDELKAKVGE